MIYFVCIVVCWCLCFYLHLYYVRYNNIHFYLGLRNVYSNLLYPHVSHFRCSIPLISSNWIRKTTIMSWNDSYFHCIVSNVECIYYIIDITLNSFFVRNVSLPNYKEKWIYSWKKMCQESDTEGISLQLINLTYF